MQSSIQRIGVIGLGHMGSDFAGNLIADGYQVTVYDRDQKHAAPLVARGATAAAAIADLASCEVVLTSLPDDDALADVTLRDRGLIHTLASGAIGLVHDRLVATIARGWTELDWSALGLLAASDAGLPSAMGKTPGP
jgi:3-hydroxyisobutyrate dehydrogenase-like beta-hydroxyacid dehydrogenase